MKLSPSAIKNEYNAAIHFIKFLKRFKNLCISHPNLNAMLENVKDTIMTFQEGNLKKIKKDHKAKVAHNVHEGLPFNLDDVERQYGDDALRQKVGMCTIN